MSMRYVWQKYARDAKTGYRDAYRLKETPGGYVKIGHFGPGDPVEIYSGYGWSPSDGSFWLTGRETCSIEAFTTRSGYFPKFGSFVYGTWEKSWDGITGWKVTTDESITYKTEQFVEEYTYFEKGSYLYDVSSANADRYPEDGYSGSYWYVKLGQDSIDPAAINLPATIVGGQNVIVSITPSSAVKFGGVIQYQIQYQLNSGEWQNFKVENPTLLSYSLFVPKGTMTIAVRALASDSMGFVSSTWVDSSTVQVNAPPSAPGSIDVENAIRGQTATITLTAATDPDGTIASYRYQRSVDGGSWVQFADANALTQTDQIQDGWGTVAYRAQAVDDVGAAGPFVASDTFTITSGLLMIGGPASNLGIRAASFSLALSIGVSGQTGVTDIQMKVRVDQSDIYERRVKQNDVITIPIDTRPMGSGRHEIYVILEKSDYNAAASYFVFTVPSVALPAGGSAQIFQDSSGSPVFPVTSARYVIGEGNKSVQTQLNELRTAHRGRTGHLGFVDAVLGPASKYQIPREKDVFYVSMIFNAPAGSGGGLFSIPPGFSGEVGGENGKITASETSLTIDLPANGVVSISQYAVDSSPQGAPDISALFVALENPKVESADTNNTTAATGLVDALRQIDAAYPSFNKYALSSAAGDITYFVASPGTIQPSTKTAVVAYVASDHPTTWYSNATMKFSEVSP